MEAERAHAAEADRNRELQEQFIDITCHELRNPLNAIYNSAIMLGESLVRIQGVVAGLRAENEGVCEAVEAELCEDVEAASTIVQCARHQQRITDGGHVRALSPHLDAHVRSDVLNVSKLKAGLIALAPAAFAPWDEVTGTLRMFREEAAARGLRLELERDPSLDALDVRAVRGDGGRFVQVLVNLLSNAMKFAQTAVRVRVGATPNTDEGGGAWPPMGHADLLPMCAAPGAADTRALRLYVAVADAGEGMTPEEQDRLFQRFAQASPRTYGKFGGSGLGLVRACARAPP
jgi:signal transduction histidine kinase